MSVVIVGEYSHLSCLLQYRVESRGALSSHPVAGLVLVLLFGRVVAGAAAGTLERGLVTTPVTTATARPAADGANTSSTTGHWCSTNSAGSSLKHCLRGDLQSALEMSFSGK